MRHSLIDGADMFLLPVGKSQPAGQGKHAQFEPGQGIADGMGHACSQFANKSQLFRLTHVFRIFL